MKETPVNKIMENTLEKMREMVDVSTIIGDPITTDGTTLIPVSKVSYGFTSGGTDLPSKQNAELFGGGGGGGISITPVAFIVIQNDKVRMMQINNYSSSAEMYFATISSNFPDSFRLASASLILSRSSVLSFATAIA